MMNIYAHAEVYLMTIEQQQDLKISELQREVNLLQKTVQQMQAEYKILQTKYEKLKVLELTLRHENHDLKNQLADTLQQKTNDEHHQNQLMIELRERLNRVIDGYVNQPITRTNLLHRPVIGLGKEYIKSMSDVNHESQQQKVNGEQQHLNGIVARDISSGNQGSPQPPVDKKASVAKHELSDFRQLQSYVNELNQQLAHQDGKEGEIITNKINNISETNNEVINHQESDQVAPFSYQDLIHAEKIYSKPLQGHRSRTTTTINMIEDDSKGEVIEPEKTEVIAETNDSVLVNEDNEPKMNAQESTLAEKINEKTESDQPEQDSSEEILEELEEAKEEGNDVAPVVEPSLAENEQVITEEMIATLSMQDGDDESNQQSDHELTSTESDPIIDDKNDELNLVPLPEEKTETILRNDKEESDPDPRLITESNEEVESFIAKDVRHQSFFRRLWEKIK